MDSFYDAPRRLPVPTQVERFCSALVVPEVSMLCAERKSVNGSMPYNTWKTNQYQTKNINVLTSDRQNMIKGSHNLNQPNQFTSPQNTSQLLRKQVRFQSPILQQRSSLTFEPINKRKVVAHDSKSGPDFINDRPQMCGKSDLPLQESSSLNGQTFEQMYMANVPNRHLDLSFIDSPSNSKIVEKPPIILEEREQGMNSNTEIIDEIHKNKENHLPKTYREFLETQKKVEKENQPNFNDSVTDIFNYKRNKLLNCDSGVIENVSQKCSSKLKSKIRSDLLPSRHSTSTNLRCNGRTETQKIAQHSPDFKRPIHDVEFQGPQYPNVFIKYLPSYECSQSNFFQDRLENFGNSSPTCDSITQTSIEYAKPQTEPPKTQTSKDDLEPTNKELLQIIAEQNEQLLLLQKQVAILLNNNQQTQPRQIEAPSERPTYRNEKCITSTRNENFLSPIQDASYIPRKRGLSKFSIDLMTSFEVAIRQQRNKQNYDNFEPKIQEVTESESVATESSSAIDKNDKSVVDTSLHLQEPVNVRETCPSPEPSININMNDYDSSEEEVSGSEIGATFYHNLMGQVNNILKNAQVQTKEYLGGKERGRNGSSSNNSRDKTMSRVKEATLKHLKNIGVTIGPADESGDFASSRNDSKDYSPTEISFAVKQLLMKYLPDEQLAKISYKNAQTETVAEDDDPGIINARPDFSFASVQYMRKYNLIPTANERKPRDIEHVPKAPYPPKADDPKILDITALKLQPKLL